MLLRRNVVPPSSGPGFPVPGTAWWHLFGSQPSRFYCATVLIACPSQVATVLVHLLMVKNSVLCVSTSSCEEPHYEEDCTHNSAKGLCFCISVRVQWPPHRKAVWRSECIAPRILCRWHRWMCGVIFTPRRLYSWGKRPHIAYWLGGRIFIFSQRFRSFGIWRCITEKWVSTIRRSMDDDHFKVDAACSFEVTESI